MQEKKRFLHPTAYDLKSFFEADWTRPAGAWPTSEIISENSKWRSETMDWKGCHLLLKHSGAEKCAKASVTPSQYTCAEWFGDSRHFLS